MLTRKHWALLLIAAVCIAGLGGCSSSSAPSIIRLNAGGEVLGGFQSSYCWDQFTGGTLCVDTIEPMFDRAIPLPEGEPVTLELDSPLPDALRLVLTDELFGDDVFAEDVAVERTVEWNPSVPPGDYVLNVEASWRQGDVTYWFYISIP